MSRHECNRDGVSTIGQCRVCVNWNIIDVVGDVRSWLVVVTSDFGAIDTKIEVSCGRVVCHFLVVQDSIHGDGRAYLRHQIQPEEQVREPLTREYNCNISWVCTPSPWSIRIILCCVVPRPSKDLALVWLTMAAGTFLANVPLGRI